MGHHSPIALPEMGDSYDSITVQEGEPIYLLCEVITLEPVEIQWQKEGSPVVLKHIEAVQSEMLNYTIEYAEMENMGKYVCSAKNSLGTTELHTMVDVRSSPLLVFTPQKAYDVAEGDPYVKLGCKVSPKKTPKVYWLFKNSTSIPSESYVRVLIIIHNNPSSLIERYTFES